VAGRTITAQVERLGGPVGRGADPQVVKYHSGPAGCHVPEVGLVEVVVETDQAASLTIGSVGLNHLPTSGDPLAPPGLHENASLVGVDHWIDDHHGVDKQ
jgi:hypothetical protein